VIWGCERLFGTVSGDADRDDRIAATRSTQTSVLPVPDHPEIPLHTNAMELGARCRVGTRAGRFGPRTNAGTRAWDIVQTSSATAQTLGVNADHSIRDRRSGVPHMLVLADLSDQRAPPLSLGLLH